VGHELYGGKLVAKNVNKQIKKAGRTISNKELNKVVKATGSVEKALNKISSVQQSAKQADKPAPSINAGAVNMLIKQAQSTPAGVYQLGSSKIAQAIRGMAGTPAGPMDLVSQNLLVPGSGLMTLGTVLKPGGGVANKPQPMPVSPYAGAMDGKGKGKGKDKGKDKGPNTEVDPNAGGPGGLNITQEELDKLIADGIQTGIDSYMSEYGLGNQQYDPYSGMSDLLGTLMAPYQNTLSSQMDLMSQFSMPQQMEPMRMFGAGQNYNINSVRAAQRDRQRRSGYLRGNMGIGGGSTGAPGLSSGMSIGSALGTLGGVTV
jgi:hypothetical protein